MHLEMMIHLIFLADNNIGDHLPFTILFRSTTIYQFLHVLYPSFTLQMVTIFRIPIGYIDEDFFAIFFSYLSKMYIPKLRNNIYLLP